MKMQGVKVVVCFMYNINVLNYMSKLVKFRFVKSGTVLVIAFNFSLLPSTSFCARSVQIKCSFLPFMHDFSVSEICFQ